MNIPLLRTWSGPTTSSPTSRSRSPTRSPTVERHRRRRTAAAAALTVALQSVNGDRHLRVRHYPEGVPPEDDEADVRAWLAEMALQQGPGISEVRRLEGNTGLMTIGPIILSPEHVGPAAAAAFTLLQGVARLVIDLRGLRRRRAGVGRLSRQPPDRRRAGAPAGPGPPRRQRHPSCTTPAVSPRLPATCRSWCSPARGRSAAARSSPTTCRRSAGRGHRRDDRRRGAPARGVRPHSAPAAARADRAIGQRGDRHQLGGYRGRTRHCVPGRRGAQQSSRCQATALWSVSEATWSMITRSRAVVVGCRGPVVGERAVQRVRPAVREDRDQLGEQLALPDHRLDPVVGLHHVVRGDPLEHRDLQAGLLRDDEVGGVAHERPVAGVERRVLHGAAEPADQVAGEVLQRGQRAAGAVVRRLRPAADRPQTGERLVEERRRSRRGGTRSAPSPRPRRGRSSPGRPGRRPRRPRCRGRSRRRRRRGP